ncbi:MAG: AbrB/MazE/SpoVT family DNA-binding domain-containing protein [Nitrososphaerales archaeon]
MEVRKIQRGGSDRECFLITLPKAFAEKLGLDFGDFVTVDFEDGAIVVRRLKHNEAIPVEA